MVQLRKTCPYNPMDIDCDHAGMRVTQCLDCGWNPSVARERKKKIRDKMASEKSRQIFVYGVGGSAK